MDIRCAESFPITQPVMMNSIGLHKISLSNRSLKQPSCIIILNIAIFPVQCTHTFYCFSCCCSIFLKQIQLPADVIKWEITDGRDAFLHRFIEVTLVEVCIVNCRAVIERRCEQKVDRRVDRDGEESDQHHHKHWQRDGPVLGGNVGDASRGDHARWHERPHMIENEAHKWDEKEHITVNATARTRRWKGANCFVTIIHHQQQLRLKR